MKISLREIMKISLSNMSKHIGQIILVTFIVFICIFGTVVLSGILSFIPLIGFVIQLFTGMFITFILIVMSILCLNTFRNKGTSLGAFSDLFGDEKSFVYLKSVIGKTIAEATISLLVPMMFFIVAAILTSVGKTFPYYFSIRSFGIMFFVIIIFLMIVTTIISYIVRMFLTYVFFVAIDAKEEVRISHIFSLSNKIISGNRRKHFLLDLIYGLIFLVVMIVFAALATLIIFLVESTKLYMLTLLYIPLFILLIFLAFGLAVYRGVCFAGLYEKILISSEAPVLLYDVYNKEFIDELKNKYE